MSKEQFIGTWKLVSLEFVGSDGEVSHPFGTNAAGIHTWSESGHFAFQGGSADRAGFASDDPLGASPEEAASAINTYAAYFGTYAVDEDEATVTHTPVAALFPNWIGAPQKRWYEFSGNRLTLTTASLSVGGKTVQGRIVWERN